MNQTIQILLLAFIVIMLYTNTSESFDINPPIVFQGF